MDDWELLQAYAKQRSEAAFTELVRRHLDWVYSAALRCVGDTHLAGDVAQSVFVLLARKAGSLRSGTVVSGWLFRTTRFVASRAARTAQRRKAREEIASTMMSTTSSPDDNEILWNQLAPHLDQAVAALSETDRSAILLRFYERKPLREIGQRLGMSEEAAKKRVSRAVEKMRDYLTSRGVVLGGAGLIAVLADQTVHAAPATLAVTVLKASLAGASASAVLPQLARETLNAWRWSRLGGMAASVAAVSVTGVILTATIAPRRAHDAMMPGASADRVDSTSARVAGVGAETTTQLINRVTSQAQPSFRRALELQVVQAQTGQPLAGVEIGVENGTRPPGGQTDEQGHCRIGLPDRDPESFSVTAHKDGFVPMRADWRARYGVIRLPQEFTFTLEPATSIGGIVQNDQGQPIPGAAVFISDMRASSMTGMTEQATFDIPESQSKLVTDLQGRWQFDLAPAGLSSVSIRLAHPEYTSESYYGNSFPVPPVGKLRDRTGVMVMRKSWPVEGVVLDELGQPIAGASVLQDSVQSKGASYRSTSTDANGRFRFAGAVADEMLLTFQAESYAPELSIVTVGPQLRPLEVRLRRGNTIRGRVVDKQGEPVAGASVRAELWRGYRSLEWHTETDAEGRFVWSSAPPDEVQLSVSKKGFMSLSVLGSLPGFTPSEQEQVITLGPLLRVHGRVADADAGQPIARFNVVPGRVMKQSLSWPGPVSPLTIGELRVDCIQRDSMTFTNGSYEIAFDAELPGRFVCIQAEGYEPENSRQFKSDEGEVVCDFRLKKGSWVTGVVRAPDGRPVKDVNAFLVSSARQPLNVFNGRMSPAYNYNTFTPTAATGDDGRFTLPPTKEPFLVAALNEQGYAYSAAGNTLTVPDLVLIPWARIEGVMYIDGRPAVGEEVSLWSHSPYAWETQTNRPAHYGLMSNGAYVGFSGETTCDDTGHFVLDRVAAGSNEVRHLVVDTLTHLLIPLHKVSLMIKPGETAHVTMGMGRPVVGRFAMPPGLQGPGNWSAYEGKLYAKSPDAENPGGSDYPVIINSDGSFRIGGVPPGAYELHLATDIILANGCLFTNRMDYPGYEFTMPETSVASNSEALDLGRVEVKLHPLDVGDMAPLFECQTTDGRLLRLADYQGKFLLLDFWAVACAKSASDLPYLKSIYNEFGKDGRLVVIGVSADADPTRVAEYAARNDLPWIQGFLGGYWEHGETRTDYGLASLPYIVLIGPDGKVIASDLSCDAIEAAVTNALKN